MFLSIASNTGKSKAFVGKVLFKIIILPHVEFRVDFFVVAYVTEINNFS